METRLRLADGVHVVVLGADGATVDGAPHALTTADGALVASAHGWTVEEIAFAVDGRPVRALVARRGDRVQACVAGRVFGFALGDEGRTGAAGHAGSGNVTAPMPGKVTTVCVAVGDAVEPGQALVVVEAMKMETTLAAEIAGTVSAVHVAAGAMVDAGALLVEVAPAA